MQFKNDYQYENFKFTLGISWNNNIATTSTLKDGSIFESPAFSFIEGTAQLSYNFTKHGLLLSGFYKYTGRQRVLGADPLGGAVFGQYMKDFNMIDLSIEKMLWKNRFSILVGTRNLLNIQRLATATSTVHGTSETSNITTGRSFFTAIRFNFNK